MPRNRCTEKKITHSRHDRSIDWYWTILLIRYVDRQLRLSLGILLPSATWRNCRWIAGSSLEYYWYISIFRNNLTNHFSALAQFWLMCFWDVMQTCAKSSQVVTCSWSVATMTRFGTWRIAFQRHVQSLFSRNYPPRFPIRRAISIMRIMTVNLSVHDSSCLAERRGLFKQQYRDTTP